MKIAAGLGMAAVVGFGMVMFMRKVLSRRGKPAADDLPS